MNTIPDFTRFTLAALDEPQPCDCEEKDAVRMAQTDKVRDDHFEGVRLAVAEVVGEVVAPIGRDARRPAMSMFVTMTDYKAAMAAHEAPMGLRELAKRFLAAADDGLTCTLSSESCRLLLDAMTTQSAAPSCSTSNSAMSDALADLQAWTGADLECCDHLREDWFVMRSDVSELLSNAAADLVGEVPQ